jgi:hypothetical protein
VTNFTRGKKILLVTTQDVKEWSGNAGVYHHFRFVELEVLFIQSNKELIEKIRKDYKGKSFNSVVYAPVHGAENDAKINWPNIYIACISIPKHINILTCYQGKTLNQLFKMSLF